MERLFLLNFAFFYNINKPQEDSFKTIQLIYI